MYLQQPFVDSVSLCILELLQFPWADGLLILWIEALISQKRSASRLSIVKLSLSKVETESYDLLKSSSIPGKKCCCFTLVSAP